MTGARSNPPYIHHHLSLLTPLWSGIITWGLLYKERMGRFGDDLFFRCFLLSCKNSCRSAALSSLLPEAAKQDCTTQKWISQAKKKKAICPDLFHRSVIDALFPLYVFSVFASGRRVADIDKNRSEQPSKWRSTVVKVCSLLLKRVLCFLLYYFPIVLLYETAAGLWGWVC